MCFLILRFISVCYCFVSDAAARPVPAENASGIQSPARTPSSASVIKQSRPKQTIVNSMGKIAHIKSNLVISNSLISNYRLS